jgi:S-methylmethionine-dependent homocysteine/selenocysteine methylase
MPGQHSASLTPDRLLVTDGGLETTLVFHDGIDLPEFASFTLLDDSAGRAALRRYYEPYAVAARRNDVPCLLDTATWRASPDWGAKLGYSPHQLAALNRDAVSLLMDVRAAWETPEQPVVINGAIGPRFDGYVFEAESAMDPASAAAFHGPQVTALAAAGADLLTAWTMTYAGEAAGVALAARDAGLPCIISFTVETDGRLPDGSTLAEAIAATDAAAGASPLLYMVNCAHVTHIDEALRTGGTWLARLGGVRANPSALSHAELNEATSLDPGDPAAFGRDLSALRQRHPGLCVLGGCCGSDHTHAEQIGLACRAA